MAKKSTKPKRGPVKDLWCETIETVSVDKDWTTGLDLEETGEGWSAWQAETCDKCGEHVIVRIGHGDARHCDLESDSECEGTVPDFEGPMMNYYWPLPKLRQHEEDAAIAIAHLPLCLVTVEGAPALALTGGGMDLAWEIAEAYMRLGWLPPTRLTLPKMCGRGVSPTDRWIAAGVIRAVSIHRNWLAGHAREMRDTMKWCRDYAAKQAAQRGGK